MADPNNKNAERTAKRREVAKAAKAAREAIEGAKKEVNRTHKAYADFEQEVSQKPREEQKQFKQELEKKKAPWKEAKWKLRVALARSVWAHVDLGRALTLEGFLAIAGIAVLIGGVGFGVYQAISWFFPLFSTPTDGILVSSRQPYLGVSPPQYELEFQCHLDCWNLGTNEHTLTLESFDLEDGKGAKFSFSSPLGATLKSFSINGGTDSHSLNIPGQVPWPAPKTNFGLTCKVAAVVNDKMISIFKSDGDTPKLTLTLHFEDKPTWLSSNKFRITHQFYFPEDNYASLFRPSNVVPFPIPTHVTKYPP